MNHQKKFFYVLTGETVTDIIKKKWINLVIHILSYRYENVGITSFSLIYVS